MTDLTADVAVVGGGLLGTALAYELVGLGADVVLVDRHHRDRATDAGAGILSAETTWNPDPDWFSFAMAAASHYRTLIARLADDGLTDTGYARCGLLLVANEPGEDDWFATQAELALRRSPEVVSEVSPQQARALFPPLGLVRRVLHNPEAARVDGRRITAALHEGALGRGLRRLDGTVTALRLAGDRVLGIDSDAGAVSCGAVALAAGAWSAAFGEQLGVSVPVVPVKGQIVHMQLPGSADGAGAVESDSGEWPLVSPVLNHYLVAWPGGRIACGGTYEPDALFDSRPTVAGLAELLRGCLALAPGLGAASVVDVRVGLRPVSPDGLPVLGPVPGRDNLHLLTGHGTEGLLLGPHSAALLARCLLGEPVPHELGPFRVDRFLS